MGRLATGVAAKATHADNLPTQLPNVSLIDALLPRRISSIGGSAKKPIDPSKSALPSITYTDIKKSKDGKLLMVRHKSASAIGSGAPGNGKEGAPKDTKDKETDAKEDKKEGDGEKKSKPDAKVWTANEDARLKELKKANKSWKQIAEDMGRSHGDVKARWKGIEGKAGSNDDVKKDEGGKKNDGGGASFSDDEDKKIHDLLAKNTGFKKIAAALERPLDDALKNHIQELKKDGGGAAAKDQKNDEKEENIGETADFDDGKIKELLAASTPFNGIATALGKKLDKPLKDRINKLKDEGVGEQKKEDKKEEQKTSKKGEKKENVTKEKQQEEAKPASKPASKGPSKAPSHASSRRTVRSNPRFTVEEWRTLQEDEMFSFGELQLMIYLREKYRDRGWLKIASVFMDKTGRRVHPEDIREKFAEVGLA